MSDDLAKFVAECLDVDEERANRAASVAGPDWYYGPGATGDGRSTVYVLGDGDTLLADMLSRDDEEMAQLIANFDPARVLREVAAKRAIVDHHKPVRHEGRTMCHSCLGALTFWPCPTLRHLAAAWSDHPGYRQEWKP